MGYRQHLVRSILAIREQGGVALRDGDARAGRAAPGRPQRGQARRAGRAARHRRLHHRPRRRARRPALGDLRRLPGHQGPRRGDPQGHRGGQGDLHREADGRERRGGARAGRARRARPGVKNGVVHDKLYLPGLQKLAAPDRLRLLRPHPLGARRVRLLGLRGRLAARAAAELELPRRGRRRHRRRHVPALELRAGEPVRPGRVGLRPGRHPHPDPRRRGGRSPTPPPPTTPPTRSSSSTAA